MSSKSKATKSAAITHSYRIRIGRSLWIDSVELKGKRIKQLTLTGDRKFSVVIESSTPKRATSKFDQALREALSAQLKISWADIHFVEA